MAVLPNDIYIGDVEEPLYHFTNAQLTGDSLEGVFALDVIGNELSIDTFSIVVRWTEDDTYDGFETSDGDDFILANNDELTVLINETISPSLKDFLKELPYGTPIWWYVDSEFYCKGYLKSVDRVTKNGFKLTCTSGAGLLETIMHTGNLYQAAAITDVLASIIGGAFSYTVSNAVQTSRVYGRLPYDTCRSNLHRLLFATGAALMKGDEDTDYVIDYLSEDITDVPASRVSIQGSVEYQLPSNRVEITEHAFFYLSTSPTDTLFDNRSETPADGLTIIFDSPVYVSSLATTGTLTISESGVNYAVVSGLGTLTGQYYVHTTQIDVLENRPNNEPIRVRRVTENELVTALNAKNVARRVLSYYQSAKNVKAKILLDGEQCGNLIRMTDAFGDITQAYLAKMDTLVTTVVGAQCQLVEGYQPGNNGNNFLHREAITVSGTWTVPLDIDVDEDGYAPVRIALIGGGNGGSGGYDGAEGAYKYKGTSIFDPGEPGGEVSREFVPIIEDYNYMAYYGYANQEQRTPAGGAAGSPGTQGKVYVIERKVQPGEVITFTIGAGGAGGARNGGIGSAGTATSVSSTNIGSASSADGLVTQGYFDPFNGDVLATAGQAGYAGGNGGRTDTVNFYGNQGGNGLAGGSVAGYAGGNGGTGMKRVLDSYETEISKVSGGGGGGAAYGANGSAGGSAVFVAGHWVGDVYYGDRMTSGGGGNGANAVAFPKPTYGCGGGAGNGGGGGGNCGGVAGYGGTGYPSGNSVEYKHVGGAGGRGSAGGAGGDGIGIIYY